MDLGAFSSIFELFATLTLAYILIDELAPTSFLTLITEKVFRRYRDIHQKFAEIRIQISGRETSLNNITQMDVPHKEHLDEYQRILKSTSKRTEQSFSEIKRIIGNDSATKCFGFLNCFLFFFCITMLFFGGAYNSAKQDLEAPGVYSNLHYRLDFSLFLFSTLSIIWLIGNWIHDQNKLQKRNDADDNTQPIDEEDDEDIGFFERVRKSNIMNGYVLAFGVWAFILVVSIVCYFMGFKWRHFQDTYIHDLLILLCIILPMLNFLVYILKAKARAKKSFPRVKKLAKTFYNDYEGELKKVDIYINACSFSENNLGTSGPG